MADLEPITRQERILSGEDIEPVTRLEHFLSKAAQGGGGGGFTPNESQLTAMNSGITADKVTQYDDVYAVLNYDSLNHNGIFRGKNLTSQWVENRQIKEELWTKVHAGDFTDLYLGDYFTVSITTDLYTKFTGTEFVEGTTYYERSGENLLNWIYTETADAEYNSEKTYYTKIVKTENVTLMIAAFDYYYNCGDTALTTHHIVLIPRNKGFATAAQMNETNTTEGGYLNSYMHQTVLPCYAASLKTALKNHLLSHRTILTNAVTTTAASMAGAGMKGASSSWEWATVDLQLMNEVQLYGTTVWSSSAYDVGVDNRKLPVFNFITPVQFGRNFFWLRSVVSSSYFAYCYYYGYANSNGASGDYYVRPLILFG